MLGRANSRTLTEGNLSAIAVFFLVFFVSFSVWHVSFAQDTAPTACVQQFREFADIRNQQFMVFMDQHFANRSSDSSLLDTAMAAYRGHRNALRQKVEELAKPKPGEDQTKQLNERLACLAELQTQLQIAETAMKARARKTTYVKKTTAYLDKLQQVNSKLRTLNKELGEMKGYFEVMADKLPGYLYQCVKGKK